MINTPEDAHVKFAEAFNARNMNGLLALYAPNAIFVQPGQIASGHAAIREALRGFLAFQGKLALEMTYAIQVGNTALLRGQWRLAGIDSDGLPVALTGRSVEVVQQQPDGSWLFLIDHPTGAERDD